MAFHVGQRVVCIRTAPPPSFAPDGIMPRIGVVYTIREIRDDRLLGGRPDRVLLVEIDNSHLVGTKSGIWKAFVEPGFPPNAFRPLCESRLDQFRAHLAPTPKERVPA